MAQRVGAKGQVVTPKELLQRAGLGPGTDVDFEAVDDGVLVRKAARPSSLRGRFAEEEAELLTGDPEIIDRADRLPCKVVDLRAGG